LAQAILAQAALFRSQTLLTRQSLFDFPKGGNRDEQQNDRGNCPGPSSWSHVNGLRL
jgi:hypothetical protein